MRVFLLLVIFFNPIFIFAQQNPLINPINFEYKVEEVVLSATYNSYNYGTNESPKSELQNILDKNKANGFELVSVTTNLCNQCGGVNPSPGIMYVLFFKKAGSLQEARLLSLISDLNRRIDTTAKNLITTAMAEINTGVLNYLKNIPTSVLTEAYKKQMSDDILGQVKKEYDALIADLKKRINELSNK